MPATATLVAMTQALLFAVATGFVMAACAAHSLPSTVTLPVGEDCSNVVTIMLDCLSYLTNGSDAPEPTKACCDGVVTVVKGRPGCICDALKEARDLGIAINISRVVELPAACSVNAPDVHCAPSPGSSPTPAPSSPPPPPSAFPSPPPHSSPAPEASPPPQSSPSPKPASPPPSPPAPTPPPPPPPPPPPRQSSPNPPSKQPSPSPPPPPSPTQEPPPAVTPPAVAEHPAEAPAEPEPSDAQRLLTTLLLVLVGVATCFHL